jgi:serine/threonine-protein kinase
LGKDPDRRAFGSRYLLGELIGRGAVGRVYHGCLREGGAAVAVKLLRDELTDQPDVVARFVQERNLLRGVDHPNLVRIRDLVVDGDDLGIVMDFVAGGDLRRAFPGACAPAQAGRLVAQLADGLACVHEAGVVHRDIKPENVLVQPGPDGGLVARLTDFGVSRLIGSTMTKVTSLIGTPGYMAPEVGGGAPAKAPADVYALGVVLFELCTGQAPFVADNPLALLRAHADDPVPRPVGMPQPLWCLLVRMLAKDPAARPTATQVAQELRTLAPELVGHEPFALPKSGDGQGDDGANGVATPATSSTAASPSTERETVLRPITGEPHGHDGTGGTTGPARPRSVRWTVVAASGALLAALLGAGFWLSAQRNPTRTASASSPMNGTSTEKPPVTQPSSTTASAPTPATTSDATPGATPGPAAATVPGPAVPLPGPVTITLPAPAPESSFAQASKPPPSAKRSAAPAPIAPPAMDGNACYATAIAGGFNLPANQTPIAGGPNFTSSACQGIHLKLTTALYRTWARACLERADGSAITSCGAWVFLSYPDTWDTLLASATAGSRWQLQMYGADAESVSFSYTA